jgi:hypothetical protein
MVAVVLVSLAMVAGTVAATVPKGKETIRIDQVDGKKGAVTFPHAVHATSAKGVDGKPIACKDCHHTLKAADGKGEKVEACSACHVRIGQPPKAVGGKSARPVARAPEGKVDQKSIIFHEKCIACHKAVKVEGKKLGACKACHVD